MKKYAAILIDDALETRRTAGEIEVQSDQLIFSKESILRKIPLDNLEIKAGGANNRLVFLSDTMRPHFSIYTEDRSLLKNEYFIQRPSVKSQLGKTKSKTRRFVYSIWITLSLFLLLIVGLVLSKDWMVRQVAEKVPTSWEKKAGDHMFALIQSEKQLVEMDSLKKVFLRVADPLLQEARKKGVQVEVYFSKDPTINAYALPGGKVVIQYGLIQNAKSWEEVMGVMGHELAHVTERHHIRSLVNNMGIYAIVSAFFGDVSAIAGTLASTGSELESLSNSRKFETEADEQGLKFLVAAKMNPQGLLDFFKTLEKEHQSSLMEDLSFLSTHPVTADRVANLKKKMKHIKTKFTPLPDDFSSFQKSFKASI